MRIVVTSDVHLGHPRALVNEFFETMIHAGKMADIIVIAGDVVDNDQPVAISLFERFLEIAQEHHFFEKLFFVYGGMKHEVKVLHSYPSILMGDYCLLSTAIGRIIIIHGNNIGLYYNPKEGETSKLGAERAKRNLIKNPVDWLPTITEEDYLIFGHLHRRFYYEPMKIYCTSCWVPTKNSTNDVGFILLIDDQNKNPFTAIRFDELK
ncbi:MAG: hypothetical protein GF308_00470 [Candidatus Heimdallarchaeota archaeon]|nr:hypothetical protein [Candidatus Heimdallarchaeota archaeon]